MYLFPIKDLVLC